MRADELLTKLKRAGEKGLTAQQIANIFEMKNSSSSNKLINTLRKQGYIITQAEKKAPYVLDQKKSTKLEELDDEDVEVLVEELIDDKEDEDDKYLSKRERIHKLLLKNTKYGVPTEKIASFAGINEKTVTYHIHSLRAKENCNIKCINGRYFLSTKREYNRTNSKKIKIEQNEEQNEEQIIEEALNDKELFLGIQIIPQEILKNYLDLLYKIIYYRKCAKAMLDTNKMLRRTGDSF